MIAARACPVARAEPGDEPALASFLAHMYGPASRQADPAYVAWRYGQAGGERWLCRHGDEIVGVQGGLRVDVQADGQARPAWWAVDLMIAPRWRLRGVFKPLTEGFAQAKGLMMGLGVSDGAHRAFLRAGWSDRGTVPRFMRLMGPLQDRRYGMWRPGPRQIALSRAAAPALAARDAMAVSLGRARGLSFEEVDGFGTWTDDVWRSAHPHYPALAVRDLQALEWRFDRCPHRAGYRRFVLARGPEALGYAVLRAQADEGGALSVALVDHLCPPRWLPVLLAHALVQARRQGAWALSCLGSHPSTVKALARSGFVRRPGPRFMVRGEGLPPGPWHLTLADSDLDH